MYTIILIQVFILLFTSYTIYILIRWSVLCLFFWIFLYWLSLGHYAFRYPYGHLLSIAQSLAFCFISFPFCTYVYILPKYYRCIRMGSIELVGPGGVPKLTRQFQLTVCLLFSYLFLPSNNQNSVGPRAGQTRVPMCSSDLN